MFEKEAEERARKLAEEWIKEHSGLIGSYRYVKYDYDSMEQAFLAGAEFGYNKAKEEMQEQGLALQSDMDKTIEQNIALKEQIEKMKCCSNCNHFNKESDIEYCQNCERLLVNSLDNFPREEIIKDEWELRR